MSIDDELNQHLSVLTQSDTGQRRQELEGERLIRAMRETCVEIARVLWDRRIPVKPIMVRSPQPSSRLVHFFKGDESNPLIKAADGWEIISHFCIDTSGKIWQTAKGDDEWEPADIAWWERQFSRTDIRTEAFVYISGNYLTKMIDDEGNPWIEMRRTTYNAQGHAGSEALPVRDLLLKGTAECIAHHSA
ncbi:hypothetical protein [Pseudarthrobacter sp. H2]|uniref:hypothetical protein n=1 Tax=Pseudarthrobacter sp. H2 TaxID=3418415 RepID=UPI003CF8D2C3